MPAWLYALYMYIYMYVKGGCLFEALATMYVVCPHIQEEIVNGNIHCAHCNSSDAY